MRMSIYEISAGDAVEFLVHSLRKILDTIFITLNLSANIILSLSNIACY